MKKNLMGLWKRLTVSLLVLAMLSPSIPIPDRSHAAMEIALAKLFAAAASTTNSLQAKSDISGHWAETAIRAGLQEGLISGYPDGSFLPDNGVMRAQLAAIINRAFHYTAAASEPFADVPSGKWYALDVSRAKAAGYMQGDGNGLFRPEAIVTRAEAAVIIANLLQLGTDSHTEAGKFADAKDMADWSRGAISAVASNGIMKGYDGNLFKARKPLTRAEAVVLLDQTRKWLSDNLDTSALPITPVIDKAGTYGPANGQETIVGDLKIDVPDVVLRNVTIKGDLVLGEGIGEGDVTLDRVVVSGTTTVKGGGQNSVHILDSALSRIVITKVDGRVRVVIQGSTAVDQVSVESGATLQVAGGSGASYGTVTVSTTGEVTLDGDFPDIVVVAPAQLSVTSGKIGNLTLTEQAAGADINLQQNVQVGTLNAGAAATIKGDGKINTASVTVPGVTIEQKPTHTIIADGISANVGGTVTQGSGSSGSGGTGSGNGSGSGGGPTVIRVTAAVGNPSAGGFDLQLTPAVPDMTITNLVMLNADGMPALVSKLRSTDQAGANYRAEGFLTGGATYTLSLAKSGYMFGASKTVEIPDVPAVTGAMVSPDLTKLILLFSERLDVLPPAPAGFTLADAGVPVVITGATLSETATRIELALGTSVNPATLELNYSPGTISSSGNKALPALTWTTFTNASAPSGRTAYNRMLGKTAEETANELKDDENLDPDAAAQALIEGGYSTNDLVKALSVVYRVSHEDMPTMLLPHGIGVYQLLIGMQEAGILNLSNLGKNVRFFNNQPDAWVRALKQAGYTDDEVVSNSWFFTNVDLARALRMYYETSYERALDILIRYPNTSYADGFGRVLYEVYGLDDRQAVVAMKAADATVSEAGAVLHELYDASPGRMAMLLKEEAGHDLYDIAILFERTYMLNQKEIVRAFHGAGYTISEIFYGLPTYYNIPAAMAGLYTAEEFFEFIHYAYRGQIIGSVAAMVEAGYSALETARLIPIGYASTRSALMGQLLLTDHPRPDVRRYNVGDAMYAVRQVFGGTIKENADMLAQFDVPTVTTMRPGEITIADALGRAHYNLTEIVQLLAPSNRLSQEQASFVLFELRNMGFQLEALKYVLFSLSEKIYGNYSNESLVKLMAHSGFNTTTNETIPGYSASEIALYLISIGFGYKYNLPIDLQAGFSKLDAVRTTAEVNGVTRDDMLYLLYNIRLYQGTQEDVLFVGQVLKEIYGASPVEAVRAIRGSYIHTRNLINIRSITDILREVYGHTDLSTQIQTLALAGYTTNQIGDGLQLSGESFKAAGYNATDVAKFMMSMRGSQYDTIAFTLQRLGYSLNELALALRNIYGGDRSTTTITNVTNLLSDRGLGYSQTDIAAAVSAVFILDPVAALAKEMHDRNTATATMAATTLKASYGVSDPVAMANILKTAGFPREDVLIAIFQAYGEGQIYASGTVSTMANVIAAVYPEVTNALDATLLASDVRTAKHAVHVLQGLNVPLANTIGTLSRVYGLNAVEALSALLESRIYPDSVPDVASAVGAYYGQPGVEVYVVLLKKQNFHSIDVFNLLKETFRYTDGIVMARLALAAGYSQSEVLYALGESSGNTAGQIASVLVQLYGDSSLEALASELFKRNFSALVAYNAIKNALPDKTQGEILLALYQSGYYSTDLLDAMRRFGRGDATAIAQLHSLGLRVFEAVNLLQVSWNYRVPEIVSHLVTAGYPLSEIGREMGSAATPDEVAAALRAAGRTVEQAAVVVYGMDGRPAMMLIYLYKQGWTNIDDLVKALAAIQQNQLFFAQDLWDAKLALDDDPSMWRTPGPARNWTATTLATSLSRHSSMSLEQLGQSLLLAKGGGQRYFNDIRIYEALKAVSDIGVSFIQADLDSAISAMLTDLKEGVPFIIMRDLGYSSHDAARIMQQLGWSWIPACIQLVQAGYGSSDTWDALWNVYRNEVGYQILNIMSAVAPLASLGLAENLTTFQSVARFAMRKAMMYYFMNL